MRLPLILPVILAVPVPALAQPDAKDIPWVVPLTVSPAPLPKPALKYLLLPDLRDRQPGNQIPAFYKCFMEQHNFYYNKESIDQREAWLKAPLVELAGVKQLIDYGGNSTRQADYAARLDTVNWAILDQFKKEGVFLLLPDVQQMRNLAQVLRLKLRGEIARQEFDTALRTAQTLMSLAQSFVSHPTLIGNLVGTAIIALTINTLEELVQQPGAPNLFWAWADLPAPFMSLYTGIQGERLWLNAEYDVLGKPELVPEGQLNRFIAQLNKLTESSRMPSAEKWYLSQVNDPKALAAATDRLAALGFPKDKLAKFTPLQVVMADDFMQYLVYRDNLMKWANLPLWQIPADAMNIKPRPGVFVELAPAFNKVKQAQARVQQRIDVLRIVEAVRSYASEHDGKLPESLDAIKLPLPIDPVAGKPYHYALKDGKARVGGFVPPDRANDRAFNRVVEIAIRK